MDGKATPEKTSEWCLCGDHVFFHVKDNTTASATRGECLARGCDCKEFRPMNGWSYRRHENR